MKIIYHLNIHTYKANRKRWLSVYYSDKQKAISELNRWADKFREEWQVPERSEGQWDLNERFNDDTNITFQTRYVSKENSCLFSGSVYESHLMEEDDEIIGMCGEVFAAGNNPDILFTNGTPLLSNDTSFGGQNPINVATKEYTDLSQVSGGANIVDEERATEYYDLQRILNK